MEILTHGARDARTPIFPSSHSPHELHPSAQDPTTRALKGPRPELQAAELRGIHWSLWRETTRSGEGASGRYTEGSLNGEEVAVKVLTHQNWEEGFDAEIAVLSAQRHQYIVPLTGILPSTPA